MDVQWCIDEQSTTVVVSRSVDSFVITVVPHYIAPRYIATLAYRHEFVKNGFSPMLIPPV